MADAQPSDTVILKLLSGVQAGVEVALSPGQYRLGTGTEDDIQLVDVSIVPGHADLRIAPGTIEVAGAAGPVRVPDGSSLEPNGTWRQVEPLDVLAVGTTRFALGYPTSQWATVVADGSAPGPVPAPVASGAWADLSGGRVRALAGPIIAVALLLTIGIWLLLGGAGHIAARFDGPRDELALTREALDAFPFGRPVAARQAVDGTVTVQGYVASPVERRALTAAVEKTGVPARIRLWVLENIRGEVEGLIADQKVPVTFTLSPEGVLTLNGLILNAARAERFVDLIRDRVVGLGEVQSRIRTSQTLLVEVEKLAAASQIQPYVLLRAANDLIEVTGAIPAARVDAFLGFLQSYARRFAREIPLRSYVQLQGSGSEGADRTIVIGGPASGADIALDAERLAQGGYRPGDIFADGSPGMAQGGARPGDVPAGGTAGPVSEGSGRGGGRDGARTAGLLTDALSRGMGRAGEAGQGDAASASGAAQGNGKGGSFGSGAGGLARAGTADGAARATGRLDLAAAADGPAGGLLEAEGRRLLDRLRTGEALDARAQAVASALAQLRASSKVRPDTGPAALPGWYLPMLDEGGPRDAEPCWTDSRIAARDTLAALFWLDLLSINEGLTLADLGRPVQLLLLEVALNPTRTRLCADRDPQAAQAAANSVYLREIRRNPAFIRFIARDLPAFPLDIAGASLGTPRFVLTKTGRLHEGTAPNPSSRVATIGELGLAMQLKSGLATAIFEPDMTWKITQ